MTNDNHENNQALPLKPVDLGPELNGRIAFIKEKYRSYFANINLDPSHAINGAFYALRNECSTNPEWKNQAGHSIREIIYPLVSRNANNILKVYQELLNTDNELNLVKESFLSLYNYYSWFTDLAHHCTKCNVLKVNEYNKLTRKVVEKKILELLFVFEKVLGYQQIYTHKCIDLITAKNIPKIQKKKLDRVKRQISIITKHNQDSKSYFFNQVKNNCVNWLLREGYFQCLSNYDNDIDVSDELFYLDRAAKFAPSSVVKVIIDTKITKKNFKPDVISRFIRIMSSLPAKQLTQLIPKLIRENWVKLLNRYNHWGFEYKDMFETLTHAGESQAILDLASVVLSVKDVVDLRRGNAIYMPEDDTFYFDSLAETGVFSTLNTLPASHQESALKILSTTLSSVVELWDSQSEKDHNPNNPFDKNDHFMLASYIPSQIKPKEEGARHREDNIYDLTASLLCLFDSLVDSNPKPDNVRNLYTKYFASLPNSQATWRLKLYIIKQRYPKLFAEEYKQAKAKGYSKIENTLEEPIVGPIISGDVIHRSPLTQEEFSKLDLKTIISKLKSDWSPSSLAEQNKGGDFFNPLAPDAIGDLMQDDFPNRLQAYLDLASSFFDQSIHLHYTHRYLTAIKEYVKNNRGKASQLAWDQPIRLISTILKSAKVELHKERGSWLANWDWIYSSICELLTELLTVEGDVKPIDFDTYRSDILSQLKMLLEYRDPIPEDEDIKSATSITSSYGDKKKKITDPYTMAINSVRGKAHRTLLGFVYRDGKELRKNVKDLYKQIIERENTRAVSFLFGHQLPPFYYRDKDWTREMLKIIFNPKRDNLLGLAAWEGYLSNNLYEEIFFEPYIQKLYSDAIGVTIHYPHQKHFLDPQKGLAGHLALAFMYYQEFGFNNPLFKKFWKNGNSTEQAEFIALIGRNLTSRDDKRYLTKLQQNPDDLANLQKLWTFVLGNTPKLEVLTAFGYWVGPENKILDPAWLAPQIKKTLEITKGQLEWDYGLTQTVTRFAHASPIEVVDIARLFFKNLITDSNRHPTERYVEKEWKQALEIAYKEGQQERVKLLIDQLITKGGRSFWTLKDIICENIQ